MEISCGYSMNSCNASREAAPSSRIAGKKIDANADMRARFVLPEICQPGALVSDVGVGILDKNFILCSRLVVHPLPFRRL